MLSEWCGMNCSGSHLADETSNGIKRERYGSKRTIRRVTHSHDQSSEMDTRKQRARTKQDVRKRMHVGGYSSNCHQP